MIEGILNVDKPLELTSHDVVSCVRRLAQTRRVGHGGTLDPLATGVLVLALGRATRLLEYVVGQPKVYRAKVRLGQTSNTYDAEGELADSGPVDVSANQVVAALGRFRGHIQQVPPMFSAIKRQGKPLYELARRGIEVQREPRHVIIYELELLQLDLPDLTLHIRCSSGTYIRSLAHDLGQELGSGAYLSGLQRTAVGRFTVGEAVSLETLETDGLSHYVQGMDRAVLHLPQLHLSQHAAANLSHGQWVEWQKGDPENELARAYDPRGVLVGIVSRRENNWLPQKILFDPPVAPDDQE